MTNYKKIELGKLADIAKLENGKVFIHDALELTSCEISLNNVPAGFKLPFKHKHKQNEEVYIIIKGEGTFILDNEKINIKEGDCVKVLPNTSRTFETTTEFQFICIQAKSNSLEQFGLEDAELC